jgi:hypothetical protein
MNKLMRIIAILALALFLTTPAIAVNWDGYYTNMLIKGYLGGPKGDTMDNMTANYWKVTMSSASGSFNILTGNLKVGDGTPDVTLNGEDAYVNGTAALGGFLKTVTDDTNGKVLNINESGTVQTNAGAGGAAAWTLPAAAAGVNYCFVVMAAQELRVTPAAGDKIVHGSTVMDAEEYYFADAIGESLCIQAVDGTNWVMMSSTGTWAEQTP